MVNKNPKTPADFIVPLNINGLEGRMLRMPAPKKSDTEILFVYGHHSSLERWWGLMLVLNHYAAVTMPDLPGFGGMDSFYKIGKKPSIDNLADYLAAFIKMRYKRKKVAIAGLSFGFVIVTRMLQRNPSLAKQVTLLVSIVGFAHKDDFTFSQSRRYSYLLGTKVFSTRPTASFFRHVCLHPRILRAVYARTHNAKNKFAEVESEDEFNYIMDFEISLWHDNDVRTYMYTTNEFLRFDNCNVKVDLPIWHVSAKADRYFDEHVVEQHMRVIFSDFYGFKSNLKNHAPSIIADEKMAAPLLPTKLRQTLARL